MTLEFNLLLIIESDSSRALTVFSVGTVLESSKNYRNRFFLGGANFELGKKKTKIGCFVNTAYGAVVHVPKQCVSNQKDVNSCRFLSVLSCKHGRRRSGKVTAVASMTRVWLPTSLPIFVQS